jgi:hypothetical protein
MGGSSSRHQEPVGEYLSKRIASEVQGSLDEYMANNPDFPVSLRLFASRLAADSRPHRRDRKRCCSLSTDPWTLLRPCCTSSGIKPW